MKLSKYVAALGCLYLSAYTLAAPVLPKSNADVANTTIQLQSKKNEEARKKYFHEPGSDDLLGHYDLRYFHGIVSDSERNETQLHMIRAYLSFFSSHGLDTWIAHGTLLGWWWNGKRLPWDWDMDTQVSGATLAYVSTHFNHTTHNYTSPSPSLSPSTQTQTQTQHTYLLDINPWIWQRTHGDGMNIIDARWIDIRNGLFIDITGLSETQPDVWPGVWSCKNGHRYDVGELFPLRETVFEGVSVLVPFLYERVLVEEYGVGALVETEFEGHKWNKSLGEWVKTREQREKELRMEEEKRFGNGSSYALLTQPAIGGG